MKDSNLPAGLANYAFARFTLASKVEVPVCRLVSLQSSLYLENVTVDPMT